MGLWSLATEKWLKDPQWSLCFQSGSYNKMKLLRSCSFPGWQGHSPVPPLSSTPSMHPMLSLPLDTLLVIWSEGGKGIKERKRKESPQNSTSTDSLNGEENSERKTTIFSGEIIQLAPQTERAATPKIFVYLPPNSSKCICPHCGIVSS